MNTVHAAWIDFEAGVIPADASPVQRSEMRRAFYAGATSILMMQTGAIAHASDEAGEAMIRGLIEECFAFAGRVKEGAA